MKIAESWLREWVKPDLDTEALGHQLTMLGHEVDGIEYEGAGIADIVIAEVAEVSKHPDADKLSLCKVNDGSGKLVDVVCGAPNVVKENAVRQTWRDAAQRYAITQGENSRRRFKWHALLSR